MHIQAYTTPGGTPGLYLPGIRGPVTAIRIDVREERAETQNEEGYCTPAPKPIKNSGYMETTVTNYFIKESPRHVKKLTMQVWRDLEEVLLAGHSCRPQPLQTWRAPVAATDQWLKRKIDSQTGDSDRGVPRSC